MRGDHCNAYGVEFADIGTPPLAGEPADCIRTSRMSSGSLPLARGPEIRTPLGHQRPRPTPACAETGRASSRPAPPASEHPCSRGDHGAPSDDLPAPIGAPPARAGTTGAAATAATPRPEHSRLCGDRRGAGGLCAVVVGIPPLARGPLHGVGLQDRHLQNTPLVRASRGAELASVVDARNTPARAGTTGGLGPRPWRPTQHPRSCGDHRLITPEHDNYGGAPPLVRGPRGPERRRLPRHRSTPARAGTTASVRGTRTPRSEHPRSCGDHRRTPMKIMRRRGTPPLARRPLGGKWCCHGGPRNTPAGAGTTRPGRR
ncbi:hypothetical protein EDD98_4912 [Streptomyces sp. PanSC19]|nr:hypothetical protein EDD98_4912 [Streptomyces sp. PanSC19]